MPTATDTQKIAGLYAAFFNRAPDANGLADWEAQFAAGDATIFDIAEGFAGHPTFDATYGEMTDQEFVEAIYVNVLGSAGDADGIAGWVTYLADNSRSDMVASFVEIGLTYDAEAELAAGNITQEVYDGAVERQAFITNKADVGVYFAQTLGADSDVTNPESPTEDQAYRASIEILANVDTTAASVASAKALIDEAAASEDPAAFILGEEPDVPSVPGSEFMLTSGTDAGADFTGTANDDTFLAYQQQNPMAGGVSNSLSSADRIDGGAGNDSLYAEIVPEFYGTTGSNQVDIQPRITDIETIAFEARDGGSDDRNDDVVVTVDAKKILGVDSIGSQQSDGDLVIENLTTLTSDGESARNTDEITITMDHTDNFNSDNDASDLTVYFDEDYLLTGQSSEAQAFFFLLDEDADLAGNPNRLDRINVDGIRFSLDGGDTIIDLDDAAAQTAGTHAGFVAALQDELAALIADGTLPSGTTLTVDPTITDSTFLDNGSESAPIPAIVLTIGDGTEVTPIGYSQVEDAIGEYDVYGRFNAESETTENPLAVNIDLHKVGREGEGGNLIVGGKENDLNTPDTPEGRGINVFNVDVLGADNKPSNLGQLATTNSDLEEVYIRTASEFVSGDSHASLTIRGLVDSEGDPAGEAFGQASLSLVNANEFLGDLTLGNDNRVDNLSTLVATGGGDIEFYGDINGATYTNSEGDSVVYQDEYSYTTGAGEDTVDVLIDGDAVDTVDTGVTITTNSGNDNISVTLNEDVSQETMWLLENLNINAGAGDDTVEVNGIGLFDVQAGAGSDFVIIDDSSSVGAPGAWSFGDTTSVQTFADRVLYQADITVKFAGFEGVARVNTTAANNYVATQMDINQAIINAIASNPELARLLDVDLDTGMQQIDVTSVIDGLNDLAVSLYQPTVTDANPATGEVVASASVMEDIAQGLIATNGNDSDDFETGGSFDAADARTEFNTLSGSLDETGAVGTAGVTGLGVEERGTYDFLTPTNGGANETGGLNYSIINMGDGSNDLVVLDSDDDSANTLVIDQTFGKVSVVNFFTGGFAYDTNSVGTDEAAVGLHRLDFTQYLSNQTDASTGINGNGWSAVDHAVTLSGATAEANSVSVLNFNGLAANSISFDSLTASDLVAALNGTATDVIGGLVDGSLDASATTDLVGTTQNHIVLVENDQNQGEYKVFHLTSEQDGSGAMVSTDFSSGTGWLGTLDFGYSIDGTTGLAEVNLVGSAAYNTAIDTFLAP